LTKKKTTKKELESVISNLIREVEFIGRKLYALDNVFNLYLEWNKDKEKFNTFVQDKVKEAQDKVLAMSEKNSKNESGDSK
tara:strand:+ start:302 stop:544 length:243 start_codon:yes stop_codon:yes gene_type:complete